LELFGISGKYLTQPLTPVSILTRIERNTIPRTHGIDIATLRVTEPIYWERKTIKLTIPVENRNEKI
jgi:hypothetical protein